MCAAADHWHGATAREGEVLHDCGESFHTCPKKCSGANCSNLCAQNLREEHTCVCDDALLPLRPAADDATGGQLDVSAAVRQGAAKPSSGFRKGCLVRCQVPGCTRTCGDMAHHLGHREYYHALFLHHCGRRHPCKVRGGEVRGGVRLAPLPHTTCAS